ncbi:DUF4419 domain-containing protein [Longispora albida]|uniref:DUF4419 domain-containing protein n=1 Tax=Longispora albida TaxID=203523 RepID=UPI000367840D|nr:DUF4419 domain-containing protein [Longispora albida]
MIVFPVDDVVPAASPLPVVALRDLYPEALAISGDPDLAVLETDGVHPLLSAVARAFADHRPLVLSPDAVWLTIAQGLAQHVRLHVDELRPHLVGHAGRKRLTITTTGTESWDTYIGQFCELLAAEVPAAGELGCDFSTSTDTDRLAGQIVVLDAYSPYFSLWLVCICGIPSITLTGTTEDWQRIRDRIGNLATFGLAEWQRSLEGILDQFVRAANGDVDTAFWRRIYNPADAYGGDVVTGWITRFYPYLKGAGAIDVPNPMLALPLNEPRDLTTERRTYNGPGITTRQVPAVLSQVTVNIDDRPGRKLRTVALHGGLAAVAQDPDGALRPVSGWHLGPAVTPIDPVLDRIAAEHSTTPSAGQETAFGGDGELLAVGRRFGSASLFGGAWRLLPADERGNVVVDQESWRTMTKAFALADGRFVAAYQDYETMSTYWVACRIREFEEEPGYHAFELAEDPAGVPVYGTSLADLLTTALDNGGDIESMKTGNLADLLTD